MKDLNAIQYPAFVVVYGPSKHYISTYNRSEYDEHFACDLCRNVDEAKRLLEGYPGPGDSLKVYVATKPDAVGEVLSNGLVAQYRKIDDDWTEDSIEEE